MKAAIALTALPLALLLTACSEEPGSDQQFYGVQPDLPKPERGLLPSMTIAKPTPWGDQQPTCLLYTSRCV